jgi:hypothetical protein
MQFLTTITTFYPSLTHCMQVSNVVGHEPASSILWSVVHYILECTDVAMQWPRDRRINNGVVQPVSRQRIGKQFLTRMNMHATIKLLLETVFSIRSSQRVYKEDNCGDPLSSRVEAGSNTSTVTLRVVEGDEKGSLESETVKYGLEIQGTRTREWLCWLGPEAIVNDRPVLSSEKAPHINKPATVRRQ